MGGCSHGLVAGFRPRVTQEPRLIPLGWGGENSFRGMNLWVTEWGFVGNCCGLGIHFDLFYPGHSPKLPPPDRGERCVAGLGV